MMQTPMSFSGENLPSPAAERLRAAFRSEKINRPRAHEVLERRGLAGLIALKPINVYYLTNAWPLLSRFLHDFPALATFPKSPQESPYLVCSEPQALELANKDRQTAPYITFRGLGRSPESMAPNEHAPKKAPARGGFAVAAKPQGEFTDRERAWISLQSLGGQGRQSLPEAVARALKSSGVVRGRVGVDDMRIPYLLRECDLADIEFVPAENAFREIRMVKTDAEVVIQSVAGRNNAEAAAAAASKIQEGMRLEDLEQLFRLECAQRGSDIVSLSAGASLGGLPDGEVVRGKPFLVDAVSSYGGYLGDFGRCVILGEPSKELLMRLKANQAGRDAVFGLIKPGVTYSQIIEVARDAQVKSGMPEDAIIVTPHSVGLEHGDDPSRPDLSSNRGTDIILEEGMVMTIDLPFVEIGWGSGHNEDLIYITRDGFRPLHDMTEQLIVV